MPVFPPWNLISAHCSRSVDEPLEPGGDGEERPRQLPDPVTTDHHKDQRGERRGKKVSERCQTLPVLLPDLQLSVLLQVLEECQYELVAPLAIMFSSTLLQVQVTRYITAPVVDSDVPFRGRWILLPKPF